MKPLPRAAEEALRPFLKTARIGMAKRAQALQAPVSFDDDPQRECGECNACCSALEIQHSPGEEVFGIEVVNAPSGVHCPHECAGGGCAGGGCAVYGSHPLSCQMYSCWWRRGWSLEFARPDMLGIIFDDSVDPEALEIGHPLVVASEIRPGMFAKKDASLEEQPPVIQVLADKRLVLMRYWGDGHPSRVYGPAEMIRDLQATERRLGHRPANA